MDTNRDRQQWNIEEIYQSKKQGLWSIKQGSEGNLTETVRQKVTDIEYNTVATFVY